MLLKNSALINLDKKSAAHLIRSIQRKKSEILSTSVIYICWYIYIIQILNDNVLL